MHYGDEEQQKAQKLIVTVYKDTFIPEHGPKEVFIKIESIVEARHVSPYDMCKLQFNADYIFRNVLHAFEDDVFYLVELKSDGYNFQLKNWKKLTKKMLDKNPLLGLH